MTLVSAEWILSAEYAYRHYINEIDEVYPEDRHRCGDLSSRDDSECRDEESEHDRPRVTHDALTRHIQSRECECRRDDDSEDDDEKSAIFLARERGICEDEFQCESTQYDKWYQRKSTGESWYTIREIHSIKDEHIPKNRHTEWYPVDGKVSSTYMEHAIPLIERDNPTEDITHVWDFYTRESDDRTHSYLHHETKEWGYADRWLPDSIHIVDKAHERDTSTDDEHDEESLLEDGWKSEKSQYNRDKYREHEKETHTDTIWRWRSSFLGFIFFWMIQVSVFPE